MAKIGLDEENYTIVVRIFIVCKSRDFIPKFN